MRLIDKKRKDYYDSLQGLDREAEPLFIRTQSTLKIEVPWRRLFLPWLSYKDDHYPVVGFCGKLYPSYNWLFLPEEIPCETKDQERQVKHQFSIFPKTYSQPWPIFISYCDEVILNPLLGATGFQRIMDPYTAWQELRMFLSNLATPEKPIPEASDEIKIQAHGFDKKSFRKEKS